MKAIQLRDLADHDRIAEHLHAAGLSRSASDTKTQMFARCAKLLRDQTGTPHARPVAHYVPGRIEVLGKHTDYAGGRSLLATPERGFCFVAVARSDDVITIRGAGDGSIAEFQCSPELRATVGDWSNYPMTVTRRLAQNFPGQLNGADIAFASDLPVASGMSSSSALIVAMMLTLAAINRLDETESFRFHIGSAEDLASYLGCIENGQSFGDLAGDAGVGTFGGSEDHVAMLCAQPSRLKQYAYCPVRAERTIPLPADCLFAIGCSGVVAEKTGAARLRYNRLSQSTRAILDAWRAATGRDDPHLAAAARSTPDAIDRLRSAIGTDNSSEYSQSELLNRLDHFVAESEQIIPGVPGQFDAGSLEAFGTLVDRSQQLAEKLLGNQTPETIHLAGQARQLGAIAASAFGAGFGGSVWALIRKDEADEFLRRWKDGYTQAFAGASLRAEFFLTCAGPPTIALQRDIIAEVTGEDETMQGGDLRLAQPRGRSPAQRELYAKSHPPVSPTETPSSRPFQFPIWSLLLLTLAVAIGMAGRTWISAKVFAGLLAVIANIVIFWFELNQVEDRQTRFITICLCVALGIAITVALVS